VAKLSGKLTQRFIDLLTHGVCVNSTANIHWNPLSNLWDQLGNKTDCALLAMAHELGVEYKKIRESDEYNTLVDGKKELGIKQFPFSSLKKRAAIVVKLPLGGYRMFVKGASEIVLSLCTTQISLNAGELESPKPLTNQDKGRLVAEVIQKMADNAMRTICLAYRDFKDVPEGGWDKADPIGSDVIEALLLAEHDLTLIGLVGIEDPLRDEVPLAIQKCRRAGVDVRMVTGWANYTRFECSFQVITLTLPSPSASALVSSVQGMIWTPGASPCPTRP